MQKMINRLLVKMQAKCERKFSQGRLKSSSSALWSECKWSALEILVEPTINITGLLQLWYCVTSVQGQSASCLSKFRSLHWFQRTFWNDTDDYWFPCSCLDRLREWKHVITSRKNIPRCNEMYSTFRDKIIPIERGGGVNGTIRTLQCLNQALIRLVQSTIFDLGRRHLLRRKTHAVRTNNSFRKSQRCTVHMKHAAIIDARLMITFSCYT